MSRRGRGTALSRVTRAAVPAGFRPAAARRRWPSGPRWAALASALAAVVAVTSGCGAFGGGLRGVDLPGGADLGEHPYRLSVEFADVADLVPQSLVKFADVPVGKVTDIRVGSDWTAVVTVLVNDRVVLPADAQARVRATSLLGEKFVELVAPDSVPSAGLPGGQARLADGATIPLARTGRAAEVEEVLGALSMLLNGGGVAQVRTIATELNHALSGREPQVRALLGEVDHLVGTLAAHRGEITRALDGINRLSATLDARRGQIATALEDLGPGLAELEAQRGQLVDMLQALDRLSGVATDVVHRSRADLLADLELLRPTLARLAEAGPDLPNSLQILPTFPFSDASVGAFAGDYVNLYLTADLDLSDLLANLARSNQPFPGPDGPTGALPPTAQLLGPLLAPAAPAAPGFPLLGPGRPETGPEPGPARPEPRPSAPPAGGGLLGGLLGGGR